MERHKHNPHVPIFLLATASGDRLKRVAQNKVALLVQALEVPHQHAAILQGHLCNTEHRNLILRLWNGVKAINNEQRIMITDTIIMLIFKLRDYSL